MRHSIRHYPDSDFLFNSFRYREYEGSTVDFICSRGGAHSDSDIVTVFMYIEAEKLSHDIRVVAIFMPSCTE